MAGTTTNFAIPYPSSTDYVTDGATAMQSLADQVDAVMFTGASSGNLLHNGAMQVSQRSGFAAPITGITTSGYYTADRFGTVLNTLGTWTQTTNTDAPSGSGFRNALKMECTTADASPAAGDYLFIRQSMEGLNLQSIRKGTASARTLTLSFWVASFQTGTFIVELHDTDNNRGCSKPYTINASNTWEYKTVTFPADVTGALNNDNGESLAVNWWLGAGTNFTSGTLQTTWGTLTSANRAVGVTNLASSTSNRWNMTGAQLTVGSVATPFEFKSFADDLRACQRYYEKSYDATTAPATNTTTGMLLVSQTSHSDQTAPCTIRFSVPKRSNTYTFTGYTPAGGTGQWNYQRNGVGETAAALASVYLGQTQVVAYVGSGAAWVPVLLYGHWICDAEL